MSEPRPIRGPGRKGSSAAVKRPRNSRVRPETYSVKGKIEDFRGERPSWTRREIRMVPKRFRAPGDHDPRAKTLNDGGHMLTPRRSDRPWSLLGVIACLGGA